MNLNPKAEQPITDMPAAPNRIQIIQGYQFRIHGAFADQRGIVRVGKITGHNGSYVPCREYKWIAPELPELKGKKFEAFDDQISAAYHRAAALAALENPSR